VKNRSISKSTQPIDTQFFSVVKNSGKMWSGNTVLQLAAVATLYFWQMLITLAWMDTCWRNLVRL